MRSNRFSIRRGLLNYCWSSLMLHVERWPGKWSIRLGLSWSGQSDGAKMGRWKMEVYPSWKINHLWQDGLIMTSVFPDIFWEINILYYSILFHFFWDLSGFWLTAMLVWMDQWGVQFWTVATVLYLATLSGEFAAVGANGCFWNLESHEFVSFQSFQQGFTPLIQPGPGWWEAQYSVCNRLFDGILKFLTSVKNGGIAWRMTQRLVPGREKTMVREQVVKSEIQWFFMWKDLIEKLWF